MEKLLTEESNVKDDCIPQPNKKLKQDSPEKVVNKFSEETEIKIETNDDDTAEDPLQISAKDITTTKRSSRVSRSILQRIPIQKNIIKQPSTGQKQIILRKVVHPPKKLLEQIKHNLKTIQLPVNDPLLKTIDAPVMSSITTRKSVRPIILNKNLTTASVDDQERNQEDIQNQDINSCIAKGDHNVFTPKSNNRTLIKRKYPASRSNIKEVNLCKIITCTEKATHYFEAPKDARKLGIWRYCLAAPYLRVGDLLCNHHFTKEDVVDTRTPENDYIGILKIHAVPSLVKATLGCCIPQCLNKGKNTPNMYPIPIWSNYIPWLNLIGEIKVTSGRLHDYQQYRVCERHFTEESLKNVFSMIPTLNLPSKEWHEAKLQNYLRNRQPGLNNYGTQTVDVPKVKQSFNPLPVYMKDKDLSLGEEFCAYTGCTLNINTSYFRFYSFPTEYKEAVNWIMACRRPDILCKTRQEIEKFITNSIGICFQHKDVIDKQIRQKQINSVKLKDLATQNVSKESTEVRIEIGKSENEKDGTIKNEKERNSSTESYSTAQLTYVPTRDYCAFVNCQSFIKDVVRKYRFPADQELLAQWIHASGIPTTLPEDTLRSLFVCGKHFNANQYTIMGTLVLSSVPQHHTEFVDSTLHEGNGHWFIKRRLSQKYVLPPPMIVEVSKSETINYDKPCLSLPVQSTNSTNTSLVSTSKPLISAISTSELPEETKCVVKHCSADKTNHTLFPFPKRMNMYCLWVKAVENKASVDKELWGMYRRKLICNRHFEKRYHIGKTLLKKDAIPSLNLIQEKDEVPEEGKDTRVKWQKCGSDSFDIDFLNSRKPYIKGSAILREDSIEFPNMRRELRFGKDCPRLQLNKFPYKLYKMQNRSAELVSPNHKIQIHTAIIIDDNDEAEREAISLISRILKYNAKVIPNRRRRAQIIHENENT